MAFYLVVEAWQDEPDNDASEIGHVENDLDAATVKPDHDRIDVDEGDVVELDDILDNAAEYGFALGVPEVDDLHSSLKGLNPN